ncbi:unnamed protein product [Diplocarpon coronariae]|uniref:Glycosyl transferase family 8 protein n=1 Tax=Diplocarpon coronariae TaxID=2795749 RepID=A0A218ZBT6_9HELO|nr:hypothetical protein JHW43_000875 [Diplocarpon mali]OWP05497.1 hypothetical protein B2J93_7841 [Marssonina coronariae]
MSIFRSRYMLAIGLVLAIYLLATSSYRSSFSIAPPSSELGSTPPSSAKPSGDASRPKYKPAPKYDQPPIVDNFPAAASAQSAADLPPIPSWNIPPNPHVPENTPLFIGFTRNWLLLQQTVVSYITAGWPPKDIYVVENTGVMMSNQKSLLGLQNPLFLNYTRLDLMGVNIIRTATLLSFSQMQNFFLYTAIERNWTSYFWSHMDVVALSFEENHSASDNIDVGYKSLYKLAAEALRNATSGSDMRSGDLSKTWAIRFFSYDRLALVNTAAFETVGGWDSSIPYYLTDCDMHERLKMHGFEMGKGDSQAGRIFDVADSMDDLIYLYRTSNTEPSFTFKGQAEEEEEELEAEREKEAAVEDSARLAKAAQAVSDKKLQIREAEQGFAWVSDKANSTTFEKLRTIVQKMEKHKSHFGGGGRLYWQVRQHGGQGEPYYRDPDGFQKGIQMMQDLGRGVYAEKWGHRGCDLVDSGRKKGDEWRVEKDWK